MNREETFFHLLKTLTMMYPSRQEENNMVHISFNLENDLYFVEQVEKDKFRVMMFENRIVTLERYFNTQQLFEYYEDEGNRNVVVHCLEKADDLMLTHGPWSIVTCNY